MKHNNNKTKQKGNKQTNKKRVNRKRSKQIIVKTLLCWRDRPSSWVEWENVSRRRRMWEDEGGRREDLRGRERTRKDFRGRWRTREDVRGRGRTREDEGGRLYTWPPPVVLCPAGHLWRGREAAAVGGTSGLCPGTWPSHVELKYCYPPFHSPL